MHEHLRILIDLQEIDSTIIADSRTIKDIPRRMQEMEVPIKEAQSAFERAREDRESVEKQKREIEDEARDIRARVEKLKARTAEVKDTKAFQAHNKEIEHTEKALSTLTDRLAKLSAKVASSSAAVVETETALKGREADAVRFKETLETEAARASEGLRQRKSDRNRLASTLPRDLYDRYLDLLAHGQGLAITPVDSEVCGGCHMNIMPQLFVRIKEGKSIVNCPQCKRILYYEPRA